MPDKPQTVEEHARWLLDVHNVQPATLSQPYFAGFSTQARDASEQSDDWKALASKLTELDQAYEVATRFPLLLTTKVPPLEIKPFESFRGKVFRNNVIDNRGFPGAPRGGWLLPDNWFARVNDV